MDEEKCGAIEALLKTVEQALADADGLDLSMVGIRLHQAVLVLAAERDRACTGVFPSAA